MTRHKLFALITLGTTLLAASGCHGAGRRGGLAGEPALSGLDADDRAYLGAPAERQVTVVDRHPLLYKPREYWDNSGDNRIVKAAAATLIGVPAGVAGEVRQIFVGAPAPVVAAPTSSEVH